MRTWAEIRAEQNVDEEKAAAYRRVMEADQRVYDLLVEADGSGEGPDLDEFHGDGGELLWVANLGGTLRRWAAMLSGARCSLTAE